MGSDFVIQHDDAMACRRKTCCRSFEGMQNNATRCRRSVTPKVLDSVVWGQPRSGATPGTAPENANPEEVAQERSPSDAHVELFQGSVMRLRTWGGAAAPLPPGDGVLHFQRRRKVASDERHGQRSGMWHRAGLLLSVLLSFLLGNSTVWAQSGQTVEFLYPQGGQAGTTVEVMVEGHFLQHPEEVLFYQPGIRCTKLEPMNGRLNLQNGQLTGDEPGASARLTFEIAKDARPGEYQLRLRTRDNLSEMVTFWVTPFPIIMEEHAWADSDRARNDAPEVAQEIPLNSTVAGYLPGQLPQDHDWYSVECRKGQRLSVEVVATRLGTLHYGGLNDPAVKVFDAEGRELGRNDDNALHTQDPVLTVVIPRDGRYLIDMHQQMDYEAGRLRHYLMHVGTFSRPLVAFPLGGQAGTTLPVKLHGDVTGDLTATISLSAKVGPFEAACVDIFSPEEPHSPWPNRLHVARFGDVFEASKVTSARNPQVLNGALPIAINGKIESEGEVDWYRFTAKKGERYRVFGYGKTLDSELDPRIWIRPAPGNPSKRSYDEDDSRWEPHDLVGHHYRQQLKLRLDPVFMFEPDTDGDWLIGIGDTRRESGPRHVYRIEFQPHVDSAFVHFPAYPSLMPIVRDRIVLFPGQSYSRPVSVQPGFGSRYDKPLRLRATSLPPGVSLECQPFKQSDGIIPVLFHADANASIGASLIDLVVEPVDPADRGNFRGGFVQKNPATERRGGYSMYFNQTRQMALAVVEGSKFDLELERPSVPLVRNGELSVKVKVRRHDGFDGAVYCEMDWLPPGVNKQPPLIIPAGKTEASYKLRASSSATPGEYPISMTGRENDGGNVRTAAGLHYVCSPMVPLNVGEPYVTINLVRAAIERGTIGEITGEVSHHKPYAGEATLTLGRLPFGVKQVEPFPAVKVGDKDVVFRVEVTKDCLVGQYRDIFCEATVSVGGQDISQQSGNGLLRVDVERQ